MPRAHYYVLIDGLRWKIRHNDKEYHFDTHAIAMKAAVEAAHQAGRDGHDAQVLFQGRDRQWQTEWTYGNDPYPPSG